MEHQAGLYEAYVKRLLDLVLSAVALLLLSPVILVVAILVRCNLGAPVIFCINPFISLWLGKDYLKDYLLDTFTVIIIIINFYTAGVQYPSTTYREVAGLFAVGRYRPLIAAILNLLISIVLANHLGIAGIILGTIISRICVYFWYDPYIIHKTMFGCKLRHYFFTYFKYFSATAIAGVLCCLLCQLLPLDSAFLHFAFSLIICASIPNILFFLLFRKCPEFQILKSYTLKLLRTRKL